MVTEKTKLARTVFKKVLKSDIEKTIPCDVVYIRMKNPQHYGIRELEFYGRVIKITNCFFEIAEYCDGHAFGGGDCSCTTEHRIKIDTIPEYAKHHTRKWHKNSLLEIWGSNSYTTE